VLVSLGDIARAEGRLEEAVSWFDRALAISPLHIAALRARAALAQTSGESAIAAAMLHRLVDSLETEAEQIDVLSTIATESLSAARHAFHRALVLSPGDRTLLERLRAVHEACGEWDDAVGAAVALAETNDDRAARARALVEAARLCAERAGNTPRAVALYEAAIEDDAEVPGAFQAIEQELIRVEDFDGLAAAYERQIERLVPSAAQKESCRLLGQLARVEWEQRSNPPGALAALGRLVTLAPLDPAARLAQAELLSSMGDHTGAVGALEIAAELLPSRVETYRKVYSLFAGGRDQDRAYAACTALVSLGEADIDEQLVYNQYSPTTMLAPKRRVSDDLWAELAAPDHRAEIDRLARALEPAALDAWFAEHPASGERISERLRQHPTKTTVSAARCVVWAADLLGVAEPAIYAQPDNDRVSVATLPLREHAILLGRHVLAGRSMAELSFILARHLSYSRPGWRMLTFYASLGELEALVRAALALSCPDVPGLPDANARTGKLEQLLAPRLDGAARKVIAETVARLLDDQAPLDLVGWARGVETTACRAGLLASGDVTVASAALAVSGPPVGGLSARDRALALLPFAVSERYAMLRRALGIAAG
jgi:tetratricopeptide (TPR) repeat protein